MRKWNYKCKQLIDIYKLNEWLEWLNAKGDTIVTVTESEGGYTVIYKETWL